MDLDGTGRTLLNEMENSGMESERKGEENGRENQKSYKHIKVQKFDGLGQTLGELKDKTNSNS